MRGYPLASRLLVLLAVAANALLVSATYNATILATNKLVLQSIPAGQPLPDAFAALKTKAAAIARSTKYYSVTNDTMDRPPNASKNDFLGWSRYYSPDCSGVADVTNPDIQCPWILKDGVPGPNLTSAKSDVYLAGLTGDIQLLAVGFYFFGDETWAARADRLLRAWFVDDATKMNPNADYASCIRGPVWKGDAAGVLKTNALAQLIDLVPFFDTSKSFSDSTRSGIKAWIASYIYYLRTAPLGKPKYTAVNNHATNYHNMLMSFYSFLGDGRNATDMASHFIRGAYNAQIAANGSQPLELNRATAFSYSVYNLGFLIEFAERASLLGIPMWTTANNASATVGTAARFLAPYVLGEAAWPWTAAAESATLSQYAAMLVKISAQYGDADGMYARIISAYNGTASASQPSALWLRMPSS